jgi:hypothetical protein
MVEKVEKDKGKDGVREAVERVRPRPMSKLSSETFSIEHVKEVKGELLLFNDEFFSKNFPIRKEELAKLTVFTFRTDYGKTHDYDLMGYFRGSHFMSRQKEHGRNVSLEPFTFADDKGNIYRYIDIKGVGLPRYIDVPGLQTSLDIHNFAASIKPPETIREGPRGMWGLLDYESAMKDWDESIELMRAGVGIAAPVALFRLDELFLKNGDRKTIEELKNEGIMPRKIPFEDHDTGQTEEYDYIPVLYLRAFSEVMRVSNAKKEDYEKFAKENGITIDEYADWWVGKIAGNLAKMHSIGKIHGNLITQNITMDGKIVDFDTVREYDATRVFNNLKIKELKIDILHVADAVDDLCDAVKEGEAGVTKELRASYKEEKRTLLYDTYFESFTDISKENFEMLCYLLKTDTSPFLRDNPELWEISDKTRMLFEKRFGEPLYLL